MDIRQIAKIVQEVLEAYGYVIERETERKERYIAQKLITEQFVKASIETGEKIVFPKKALITPLAKDKLREKEVTYVFR